MLLWHGAPRPGENLLGYLLRLTERNLYEPSRLLTVLDKRVLSSRGSFLFSDGQGVDALTALTGVERERLLELYYRPAPAGAMGALKSLFCGQRVSQYMIRAWEPKVCPACLAAAPFTRAAWDLAAVTACPVHRVMLLRACPKCGEPIRWTRRRVCRCKCKYNFRRFHGVPVPDSELRVSSHIYRLCGLDTGAAPAPPDGPLYGLSLEGFLTALFLVGSQYRESLGWEGGSSRGSDVTGKHTAASRSNEELHLLLNKAFRVFEDWPRSYYDFLDWRREHGRRREHNRGVGYYFGDFYTSLFRRVPDGQFEFMREGMRRYAAARWSKNRAVPPPRYTEADLRNMGYLTGKAVRERLRIDVRFFRNLLREGTLKMQVIKQGRQIYRVVEAAGVEELERGQGPFLTVAKASARLGVQRKGVMSLVEHKLLAPARSTAKGKTSWLFAEGAVEGLLSDVRGRVGAAGAGGETVSFDEAFMRAGRGGCKLGRFVRAVLDGVIIPCAMEEAEGLGGLVFTAEAADEFAASQWRARKGELIYVTDAARMLGVKPLVAFFLRDRGLLRSRKAGAGLPVGQLVSREAVEDFQATYVQASELAAELGVPPNRVAGLLMAKGVKPVTGPSVDGGMRYFFRRAEVDAFRVGARARAAEAA
jgi:hypothetical protein